MNCLEKYINCELPDLPVGVDETFLSKIAGTTGKCLSDKILKQAFLQIKTDVLRLTKLKKHHLKVPSCFECTEHITAGEVYYTGNYVYANYFKIASPEIKEVKVSIMGTTKDGELFEREMCVMTNTNIRLDEVFTNLSIVHNCEMEVYSDHCCVKICSCECHQTTAGIYLDAELKCCIEEILCNQDLEFLLLMKYGELVMLEANFSTRVTIEAEREGKNVWLMNKYQKRYREALELLVSELNTNECFICNDYNYNG